MNTIRVLSQEAAMGMDFYLLLGDFLDDFYVTPQDERQAMIEESPATALEPVYSAFHAATAHKLSNDYELEPPAWVFERKYFLSGDKPFFACRAKGDLRLYFMYVSPAEFKHRNLFVDANVLERV